MIYKHFSDFDSIKAIFESKKIFLNKLINCSGQKDFCLNEKTFFEMLDNINFDLINYKNEFPRNKFEKMCKIRKLSSSYKLYDEKIFGACITNDGENSLFVKKYGRLNISFDLDPIKRWNTGFLFIYEVIYPSANIEQDIYDLAYNLYINGEYEARWALNEDEESMPDNYENMISRLFYYFKILYKPKEFEFEHETRIIADGNKLENNLVESFSGKDFYYTKHSLKFISRKHICFNDNKYILLLDSFKDIKLKCNL